MIDIDVLLGMCFFHIFLTFITHAIKLARLLLIQVSQALMAKFTINSQCRGVLLLLHIVGQWPTVLAAGAGQVGYIFFFYCTSIFPFLCPVFWETAEHN